MTILDRSHRNTKLFLDFVKGQTERALIKKYDLTQNHLRNVIKKFAKDLKKKDPIIFEELKDEITLPKVELKSKKQINKISLKIQIPSSGIYFLILDDKIVYIGKSKVFYSRIGSHIEDGKFKFNKFSFVPCSEDKLDLMETYYIHKYKPRYNQQRDFRSNIFALLNEAQENLNREKNSR